MRQKAGKKWTAEAVSQPTIPKSDRLLASRSMNSVASPIVFAMLINLAVREAALVRTAPQST